MSEIDLAKLQKWLTMNQESIKMSENFLVNDRKQAFQNFKIRIFSYILIYLHIRNFLTF